MEQPTKNDKDLKGKEKDMILASTWFMLKISTFLMLSPSTWSTHFNKFSNVPEKEVKIIASQYIKKHTYVGQKRKSHIDRQKKLAITFGRKNKYSITNVIT